MLQIIDCLIDTKMREGSLFYRDPLRNEGLRLRGKMDK